jgi:DNA excision repair protein ERCC-4
MSVAAIERPKLRAELRPQDVTAIIDTREQTPFALSPMRTVRGTLATGDYSVAGLESVVALERKSLGDLISCVGPEREIQRLLAYPTRAVIVEATWGQLEMGGWRSNVTASSAVGSVLGWIAAGVPFILAGDHLNGDRFAARLLFIAARRRWREARALVNAVCTEGAADE